MKLKVFLVFAIVLIIMFSYIIITVVNSYNTFKESIKIEPPPYYAKIYYESLQFMDMIFLVVLVTLILIFVIALIILAIEIIML